VAAQQGFFAARLEQDTGLCGGGGPGGDLWRATRSILLFGIFMIANFFITGRLSTALGAFAEITISL